MDKANLFWQIYANLEREVVEVSKYIYFTDNYICVDKKTKKEKIIINEKQLEVYSPLIADLLVRSCVEIEAISKELYHENGGAKDRGSNDVYFDTDCLAFLNEKWGIENKVVVICGNSFNFIEEHNRFLTPLKNSGKRAGTSWVRAYQAVKHDRYSSLHLGNIKALLNSIAALYLLNIYFKNITIPTKYFEYKSIDMSFGSKVFSVKSPKENYVLDVINGATFTGTLKSEDSPYVLKYNEHSYKQIVDIIRKSIEDRLVYIQSQPELKEQEFMQQLQFASTKNENNSNSNMTFFQILSKYRLYKKVPATMPFEERKKAFVNSREWSGRIRNLNNPIGIEDITEENIQTEIDCAANHMGMEIAHKFEQKRLNYGMREGSCELVVDKDNIKY